MTISEWIIGNWIELVGVLISLLYLNFSVRQNRLLWPFGLLSALFYIVIYFNSKLYADMALQFYYVVISIYGWLLWTKPRANSVKKITVKTAHISKKQARRLSIIFIVLWIILYIILHYLTNSDVPVLDSLTTAGSLVATWMLAKKYIENWLLWIAVDAISIFLYTYKELYATALLFLVYTIIAIVGYRTWLKKIE